MSKKLFGLLLVAALVVPLGCSSEDDDDTPAPAAFGPSLVAVGDNGNILVSGDCLNWTLITGTGTLTTLDIKKVRRIPNHASRRLVLTGIIDAGTTPSEFWYSDDGGSTWTKSTVTVTAAAYPTDWEIVDFMFVNELDGYAVGLDNLILKTVDAGANWTEMNNFYATPGAVGTCVEINMGTVGGTALPTQGTLVTQTQTAATATGTVVSYDDTNEYIVVDVVSGAFNDTDDLTWTNGTGTMTGWVTATNTYRYRFEDATSMYAVETGTGAAAIHTIFFANYYGEVYEGPWKIVSSAGVAGAAGRTYTWTTPTPAFQAGSVAADFSYDDVHQFFFFDNLTGIAGRDDSGVLWTQDGGTTWTYEATLNSASGSEYWSEFVYTPNNGGWLYAIDYYGEVGRVGILYSAAGTPPWTFDTAVGRGWTLQPNSGYNSCQNDDHSGVVMWNGKIYAINQGSGSGYWSYGEPIANSLNTDDVFSNPWDTYKGNTAALGANPIEDKYIQVGTTSYYLEHWCER